MKIFITGASSPFGKALIKSLQCSYEILALEHNKKIEVEEGQKIKIINGSLKNINEWENYLSGVEIIIHLAGITHSKNASVYKEVNTNGTINLIEASERKRLNQFIFVSTRAQGENCGAYGLSKKLAEEALKKSKLAYTILQVSEAYNNELSGKEGLASLANFIKRFFIIPFPSSKKITLSPIHNDDVLGGIIATINNPIAYHKTYIMTGPETLPVKDVVVGIAKYFKLKRLFIPIPTIFINFVFFIFLNILKWAAPDQLNRLVCKKESLSENVLTDLKIKPRKFLEQV